MKVFGYIFMLCIALGACAQPAAEESTDVINQRVSQTEFKQLLAELEEVQLIDVRTPAEVQEGTIEGSEMIDFNESNFAQNIQQLDKQKPVMIFCRSGGRSGRALAMMKEMGFQEVYELEGGFSKWTD